MPTRAPIATPPPAVMERVYAALAPANLRIVASPPVLVRGAHPVFAFELVNRSGAALDVGVTRSQTGTVVLGAYQAWIEPLTRGASLDGCASQLARRGTRIAVGGRQLTLMSHAVGQPFGPQDGLTVTGPLPEQLLGCMPSGRYRLTVEYVRLDDPAKVIAASRLDLQLADPGRWSAVLTVGKATVTAALARSGDARTLSGNVVARGMKSGGWAWIAIRTGACGPVGPSLLPPATMLAGGTGTDRLELSAATTAAMKRDLSAPRGLSIWVTVDEVTRCAALAPVLALDANRAPTTWAGGHLRVTDPQSGFVVSASSEIIGGSLAKAIDGQTGNAWNSGGWVPAWIEIDLRRDTKVTGVRLMPSQLPSPAATVHRIYGRVDGSLVETLIAEVSGVTTDGAWTDVTFKRATTVRYLRIATVQTPSWVAWREIAVLGPTLPKPSEMPFGTHDITGGIASPGQCVTAGWAVDPDDLARHVTVRIKVDGKEVWRGPADAPRADVLSAGFGHGSNGFSVPVYALLGPGDWHEVRVEALDQETGRWVALTSTPKTLSCS